MKRLRVLMMLLLVGVALGTAGAQEQATAAAHLQKLWVGRQRIAEKVTPFLIASPDDIDPAVQHHLFSQKPSAGADGQRRGGFVDYEVVGLKPSASYEVRVSYPGYYPLQIRFASLSVQEDPDSGASHLAEATYAGTLSSTATHSRKSGTEDSHVIAAPHQRRELLDTEKVMFWTTHQATLPVIGPAAPARVEGCLFLRIFFFHDMRGLPTSTKQRLLKQQNARVRQSARGDPHDMSSGAPTLLLPEHAGLSFEYNVVVEETVHGLVTFPVLYAVMALAAMLLIAVFVVVPRLDAWLQQQLHSEL